MFRNRVTGSVRPARASRIHRLVGLPLCVTELGESDLRLADRCTVDVFGEFTQAARLGIGAVGLAGLAGYTLRVGPRKIGGLYVHDVAGEAQGVIRGCDVGAILDETRGWMGSPIGESARQEYLNGSSGLALWTPHPASYPHPN